VVTGAPLAQTAELGLADIDQHVDAVIAELDAELDAEQAGAKRTAAKAKARSAGADEIERLIVEAAMAPPRGRGKRAPNSPH
jgi:hypothetical protein